MDSRRTCGAKHDHISAPASREPPEGTSMAVAQLRQTHFWTALEKWARRGISAPTKAILRILKDGSFMAKFLKNVKKLQKRNILPIKELFIVKNETLIEMLLSHKAVASMNPAKI